MKIIHIGIVIVALSVSGGCATTEFSAYEGGQQNWPLAAGAIVDRHYAVPVYYGPPAQAYDVIGYLNVSNARTSGILAQNSVAVAADEAVRRGGDALILQDKGKSYAGTYSTANVYGTASSFGSSSYGQASGFGMSTPLFKGHASAVIIKWRRTGSSEVESPAEGPANETAEELWARTHPGWKPNR